jgi:4-amino-4-deoxy-L-arabinose transferase-like glycosyltransferase
LEGPELVPNATGVWQEVQEQRETWLPVARQAGDDGRLDVEVVRPGTMVRVLLGAEDRSRGLVVELRPETHHLLIGLVEQGEIVRELVGGEYAYRPTTEGALRKLLRELGRAWLWALLLLSAAVLSSWPQSVPLPRRGFAPAAGLLALTVLGVTLYVARVVLEGIPHVTVSVAYLFQARTFALGRLWAPTPPLVEFFDHQHLVVLGDRWFSKYPPGSALALLPGVVVGAPWVSSPLLAALTILLVFDLGRQAYGGGTGLLAAALLAVAPFFIFMSGDMMGHPFALVLTLAALSAAARARRGQPLAAAGCGLAMGLLFVTRPLTALALAFPIAIWLLPAIRQSFRCASRLVPALLAGAALPLLGWLLYLWAVTGSPFTNTMTLYWPYDRLGFESGVGNLGGHDLARGVANSWINLLELNSQLFGWPVYLTLAPALAALLFPGRSRWDLWLGGVALMTSAIYVFWWFPGTIYGPRYTYEAIGALAILTARGLTIMASGARPTLASWRLPLGSVVLSGGLLVLLVGWNVGLWMPHELRQHVGYNGVDRSRLTAVDRARLDQAIVFVAAAPDDWQAYSSVFGANSPLLDGPVLFAHDLGARRNAELLHEYPNRQGYLLTGTRLRRIS